MNNKLTIYAFWAMILCLALHSCESDIDLYSNDQSNQLIVYGILDCTGNQQLIKIGRMSEQYDSGTSLMSNLTAVKPDSFLVSIQEWTDTFYATYVLKQSDIQSSSQMTSYVGQFKPMDFMNYKLVINNLNTSDLIIAKTTPLADPEIMSPVYDSAICWIGYKLAPFEFRYSVVPEGMLYQVQLSIQYADFTLDNDTVFQEASYAFDPIYYDHSPTTDKTKFTQVQSFSIESMLDIFSAIISPSENIRSRQVYRLKFTIWVGNAQLRDYLRMSTSYEDNRKQAFSNIVGGIGFFGASSHACRSGMYPDPDFLAILAGNSATSSLKFQSTLYKGTFGKSAIQASFPILKKNEAN